MKHPKHLLVLLAIAFKPSGLLLTFGGPRRRGRTTSCAWINTLTNPWLGDFVRHIQRISAAKDVLTVSQMDRH